MKLNEFMKEHMPEPIKPEQATPPEISDLPRTPDELPGTPPAKEIPQGRRNNTMHTNACRLLKKYGAADGKALDAFRKQAQHCVPLLDEKELCTIWNSAVKFYTNEICADPNYIPPDVYNADESLSPEHFTDVDEAAVLWEQYNPVLRFCTATGWLVYDGSVWRENEQRAHGIMHELTERQLAAIADEYREATEKLQQAGEAYFNAQIDKAVSAEDRKRLQMATKAAQTAVDVIKAEKDFYLKNRNSLNIKHVLTEAETFLLIDAAELDADALLLNTPAGTVELQSGNIRSHDPLDFCTKITAVAPDTVGAGLFREFMQGLTSGDESLQAYLQEIAGMFLVGAVFQEQLTIAHGEGGNGKSTYFNLLVRVLGNYAEYIASDVLTQTQRNKKPEFAELRGKRLVVAGETEEGMRFDTGTVKNLCSTDPIRAEAKYHAPFEFLPSHSLILYTNHLPKVGTIDKGTWDRFVIVPFKARFRGSKQEIPNYTDYLFKHCGGAVLTWMINGAKRYIANGYKVHLPGCVKAAIDNYRCDNDWLNSFINECCEKGETLSESSGRLYEEYRRYCDRVGDYKRNAPDFKNALETAGFTTMKTQSGKVVKGLHIKPAAADEFTAYNEPTPWG